MSSYTNARGIATHYTYVTNSTGQTTSQGRSSKVGTNHYNEVLVDYSTNGIPMRTVTFARTRSPDWIRWADGRWVIIGVGGVPRVRFLELLLAEPDAFANTVVDWIGMKT